MEAKKRNLRQTRFSRCQISLVLVRLRGHCPNVHCFTLIMKGLRDAVDSCCATLSRQERCKNKPLAINLHELRKNLLITGMTQPKSAFALVVGPLLLVVDPFSSGNQQSLVLNASWFSLIGCRWSCRPTIRANLGWNIPVYESCWA